MDSNDGCLEEASGDGRLGLCGGLEIFLGEFEHLGHVFRTHIRGSEHGGGPKFLPLALPMPMLPALVGSKWNGQEEEIPNLLLFPSSDREQMSPKEPSLHSLLPFHTAGLLFQLSPN